MVSDSNSTVDFLLARIPNLVPPGADLNTKNQNGQTVLHVLVNDYWRWVTTAEGSKFVTELIKLGADPTIVDEEGSTPLHCLMRSIDRDIVDLVLAMIGILLPPGGDLNSTSRNGQTIFHALMDRDMRWTVHGLALITELIKLGANPKVIDEDGFTPLHYIIHWVNETDVEFVSPMVCKMVEHGANLNARNKYRQTILHQLLLKPYHSYYPRNDIAISRLVAEILRLGADPNLRDKYGRTALWLSMLGLSEGNLVARLSIVNELAQHGAELNLKDRRGRTPLSVLMSNLCRYNVDATVKMVVKLVELGVDPNVKDEKGRTVLHLLMEHGPLDNGDATLAMITKLVELGFADMNARDNNGRTAMHFLILNLYAGVADDTAEAMMRKLVDLGVNPNLQDKDGQTVLHFLAKKSKDKVRQKGRLFAILDQNGVDLAGIEDDKGNAPITYLGNPDAFDATTGFLWLRSMVSSGYLHAD